MMKPYAATSFQVIDMKNIYVYRTDFVYILFSTFFCIANELSSLFIFIEILKTN